MTELEVVKLQIRDGKWSILLKEKGSEFHLQIFIGETEAANLARTLKREVNPRPDTLELFCSVLDIHEVRVVRVVIYQIINDTFYAKMIFNCRGQIRDCDARPSDAIPLGLRFRAPIFAEEEVILKAGFKLDQEPNLQPLGLKEGSRSVDPSEIDKMSAFNDFIQSLDLDDFDQSRF